MLTLLVIDTRFLFACSRLRQILVSEELLSNNIYQWIAKKLWLVTLCSLVAFALYISFGRYLASNIDKYSEIFLETINSQAPFTISAQSINGAWTGLTPELTIKNTKFLMTVS